MIEKNPKLLHNKLHLKKLHPQFLHNSQKRCLKKLKLISAKSVQLHILNNLAEKTSRAQLHR